MWSKLPQESHLASEPGLCLNRVLGWKEAGLEWVVGLECVTEGVRTTPLVEQAQASPLAEGGSCPLAERGACPLAEWGACSLAEQDSCPLAEGGSYPLLERDSYRLAVGREASPLTEEVQQRAWSVASANEGKERE
ncbi:hypothetical protein BJV78DRAFT_1256368 [Lactifluus subvellereus]|nr:hypothetical protein BJV78DRAFT_1256368 [Lactifluus subvellereus]